MKQVQFKNETIPNEFTKHKIYDTYITDNNNHLAVIDDAGDKHIIGSVHNADRSFEGDASLNERFSWGSNINPAPKPVPAPKKLRVKHFPQIPGSGFEVPVQSLDEAKRIMSTLAAYDIFQYQHKIKPDYNNITILEEYDPIANEWVNWSDEESGIDNLGEYLDYLDYMDKCKVEMMAG